MRHWLTCCVLMMAVQSWAADDALWIDVRTPEEYASGHLDGAINIHYQDIATAIAKVAPDKRTPIRLYCAVGVRAQMAKFALEAQGYERVTNEGGYESLREAAGACAPQEC